MIEFTCPHCGKAMHAKDEYAGQSGRCKTCGGEIRVPAPADAAQTTGGEVERFGAYSKAAEERWQDPTEIRPPARESGTEEEQAPELPEVPEDILEKHRALKQAQHRKLVQWTAIGVTVLIAVLFVLVALVFGTGQEPAAQPAQTAPAAAAPSNMPGASPPLPAPPVAPQQQGVDGSEIVYLVPQTQVYHTRSCELRPELSTPLTLEQARQRGAAPLPKCQPGR